MSMERKIKKVQRLIEEKKLIPMEKENVYQSLERCNKDKVCKMRSNELDKIIPEEWKQELEDQKILNEQKKIKYEETKWQNEISMQKSLGRSQKASAIGNSIKKWLGVALVGTLTVITIIIIIEFYPQISVFLSDLLSWSPT